MVCVRVGVCGVCARRCMCGVCVCARGLHVCMNVEKQTMQIGYIVSLCINGRCATDRLGYKSEKFHCSHSTVTKNIVIHIQSSHGHLPEHIIYIYVHLIIYIYYMYNIYCILYIYIYIHGYAEATSDNMTDYFLY